MCGHDESFAYKAEKMDSRNDDSKRDYEDSGRTELEGKPNESWFHNILPWRWFSGNKKPTLRRRHYLSSNKLNARRMRSKSYRRSRLGRRRRTLSRHSGAILRRRRRPFRSQGSVRLRSRRVFQSRLDGRRMLKAKPGGTVGLKKSIKRKKSSSLLMYCGRRPKIHQSLLSNKDTGRMAHLISLPMSKCHVRKCSLPARSAQDPRGIRSDERTLKEKYPSLPVGKCLSHYLKKNSIKELRMRKLPRERVKVKSERLPYCSANLAEGGNKRKKQPRNGTKDKR